jgi:hypothetical protein
MAIRFSCDCGAAFEVPDEQAGMRGRCLGCGKVLSIPDAAPEGLEISPEVPEVPSVSEPVEPQSEEVTERYCPFCGAFVGENAVQCSSCFKPLTVPPSVPQALEPLSTVDWVLATALAPVGMVTGLVLLVLGKKKGLDLLGLSVIAILLWWFVFVLMGWIR